MDSEKSRIKKKQLIRPANDLRRRAKGTGYIEEIIIDIIDDLDTEIDEAVERREQKAVIQVPTDFDIPTLSNKDAQMRIYGILTEILLEAEYTPLFIFKNGSRADKQRVDLQVTWKSKSDKEEEKYINELVQKHSVVSNDANIAKKKPGKYGEKVTKEKSKSEFRDLKPKYSKDPSKKNSTKSSVSKKNDFKTMKPSRFQTSSSHHRDDDNSVDFEF